MEIILPVIRTSVAIISVAVGFFGSLYLLLRLINFIMCPDKVRQEKRWMKSHRFYSISGRGKIAYLILCLESALQFYKQDISAWEWLLRRLWSITECSEESGLDIWFDSVGELLPHYVLIRSDDNTLDFKKNAQTLYIQAGSSMIVINEILDSTYNIVGGWFSGDTDEWEIITDDPDVLRYIDKAEATMREFAVPLPLDELVQCLLAEQKSPSFGKSFDSLRFSVLSKQDSVL